MMHPRELEICINVTDSDSIAARTTTEVHGPIVRLEFLYLFADAVEIKCAYYTCSSDYAHFAKKLHEMHGGMV